MLCLSTACRQPGEVSGAHMRLTSACGLTSRLDAQGQLRVQLSGKNPGQLHHELADHHHQARQTLPGIGGCVVAAQTHFRSPSLLPSIISSHYTHSFLTAQFVLLLTAQGFSERWGGWPCSWVALATPAPAAARPWPQRWPGRSIPGALQSLSGPPNPAAKAVSKASRGC